MRGAPRGRSVVDKNFAKLGKLVAKTALRRGKADRAGTGEEWKEKKKEDSERSRRYVQKKGGAPMQ